MALASLSQFLSRVFIDVRYNLSQERFAPINHRKWLRNINIHLRCRPVIEFAVNRAFKLYIAQRLPITPSWTCHSDGKAAVEVSSHFRLNLLLVCRQGRGTDCSTSSSNPMMEDAMGRRRGYCIHRR
jgi:hypothetical protein